MTTTVEVLPATENVTVEVDPLTGAITLELTAPDIVLYVNEGTPGTVDTTSVQTLTNKTLASPAITGNILDTNGNELVILAATASAVNELTLANAATGGAPTFSASGADTDIDINLVPKGAGSVMIGGVAIPAAAATVTLTGTQTLTNKTLTAPKIGTGINDTNGNELLNLTATASAVNELTLANAATGGKPTLSASGDDTDISINLVPKGTGSVQISGVAIPSPAATVTLTGAETLTNKTLTSPKIGTSILDVNGNELLILTATASAVNELTYANAATGGKPTLTASGGDTDITINLVPKGSGTLQYNGTNIARTSDLYTGGLQTVWIPAAAMVARTTNGAASGTLEMTTNKNMFKTLDFDTATSEYAQFSIQMPKSWNEGTVTAAFVWSHAATATNFGVTFALQGVACSNDDAGDVAFGTAQTAADTGGTTNDIYVSPTTAAITIAGSPAANDYVTFQVYRAVSDGGDTMAIDARLHGVQLYYTTDAATDA